MLSTLAQHGATIQRELQIGNILAASVAPGDLDAIAADQDLVRIAYDAPMQTQAAPDPLTLVSNLKSVYPLAVQADQAWSAASPLRGTGIGIAVIDSGLDATNRDMWGAIYNGQNSRVVAQLGMIQQASGGTTDDNGHGTWLSGIAAGRGWAWATAVSGLGAVGVEKQTTTGEPMDAYRRSGVSRGRRWAGAAAGNRLCSRCR